MLEFFVVPTFAEKPPGEKPVLSELWKSKSKGTGSPAQNQNPIRNEGVFCSFKVKVNLSGFQNLTGFPTL
ncbi:hypothetical protein [Autumnicola edwardsiae]|uniref:Uncharacterized protein n=1 Tax=Autumnicola edwardsiae TaxID=3075594 RepID=A0ABU3CTX3_9FLAO|nr:hypothetical protein [Zunongwangia sp. F297]MDT0649736.1 hypothetical protein [Zunongwangia sp. F297]